MWSYERNPRIKEKIWVQINGAWELCSSSTENLASCLAMCLLQRSLIPQPLHSCEAPQILVMGDKVGMCPFCLWRDWDGARMKQLARICHCGKKLGHHHHLVDLAPPPPLNTHQLQILSGCQEALLSVSDWATLRGVVTAHQLRKNSSAGEFYGTLKEWEHQAWCSWCNSWHISYHLNSISGLNRDSLHC